MHWGFNFFFKNLLYSLIYIENVPHESDCNQYYKCVNEIAELMFCGKDKIFISNECESGIPAFCQRTDYNDI